jgi:hypothetical protein
VILKHQNSPLGATFLMAPRDGRISVLVVLSTLGKRPPSLASFDFVVCGADDADGSLLWLRVDRALVVRFWATGATCECGVFPRVRTIL